MTDSLAEQSGPRGVLRRRAAAACVDLIVVGLLAVAVGLIAGQPPANLSGASSALWIGLAFLYYALRYDGTPHADTELTDARPAS